MVVKKNLRVMPEEAFICSLFHNLGKTNVCVYGPDMYRDILRNMEGAKREKEARKEEASENPENGELQEELPISKEKSVNDFIHELTATLMGPFDLNEFYVQLLEALYQGIGFDRVVLSVIEKHGKEATLVGRFCLGEVETKKLTEIRHPLANQQHVVTLALKTGKDMTVSGERLSAFAEDNMTW